MWRRPKKEIADKIPSGESAERVFELEKINTKVKPLKHHRRRRRMANVIPKEKLIQCVGPPKHVKRLELEKRFPVVRVRPSQSRRVASLMTTEASLIAAGLQWLIRVIVRPENGPFSGDTETAEVEGTRSTSPIRRVRTKRFGPGPLQYLPPATVTLGNVSEDQSSSRSSKLATRREHKTGKPSSRTPHIAKLDLAKTTYTKPVNTLGILAPFPKISAERQVNLGKIDSDREPDELSSMTRGKTSRSISTGGFDVLVPRLSPVPQIIIQEPSCNAIPPSPTVQSSAFPAAGMDTLRRAIPENGVTQKATGHLYATGKLGDITVSVPFSRPQFLSRSVLSPNSKQPTDRLWTSSRSSTPWTTPGLKTPSQGLQSPDASSLDSTVRGSELHPASLSTFLSATPSIKTTTDTPTARSLITSRSTANAPDLFELEQFEQHVPYVPLRLFLDDWEQRPNGTLRVGRLKSVISDLMNRKQKLLALEDQMIGDLTMAVSHLNLAQLIVFRAAQPIAHENCRSEVRNLVSRLDDYTSEALLVYVLSHQEPTVPPLDLDQGPYCVSETAVFGGRKRTCSSDTINAGQKSNALDEKPKHKNSQEATQSITFRCNPANPSNYTSESGQHATHKSSQPNVLKTYEPLHLLESAYHSPRDSDSASNRKGDLLTLETISGGTERCCSSSPRTGLSHFKVESKASSSDFSQSNYAPTMASTQQERSPQLCAGPASVFCGGIQDANKNISLQGTALKALMGCELETPPDEGLRLVASSQALLEGGSRSYSAVNDEDELDKDGRRSSWSTWDSHALDLRRKALIGEMPSIFKLKSPGPSNEANKRVLDKLKLQREQALHNNPRSLKDILNDRKNHSTSNHASNPTSNLSLPVQTLHGSKNAELEATPATTPSLNMVDLVSATKPEQSLCSPLPREPQRTERAPITGRGHGAGDRSAPRTSYTHWNLRERIWMGRRLLLLLGSLSQLPTEEAKRTLRDGVTWWYLTPPGSLSSPGDAAVGPPPPRLSCQADRARPPETPRGVFIQLPSLLSSENRPQETIVYAFLADQTSGRKLRSTDMSQWGIHAIDADGDIRLLEQPEWTNVVLELNSLLKGRREKLDAQQV